MTSKNILSHLPVIMKVRLVATEGKAATYRQERAQEEEQEEMLRDRFELSDITWYVCRDLSVKFIFLVIFSRCKCTCCSSKG